jgi:hypothetical protein
VAHGEGPEFKSQYRKEKEILAPNQKSTGKLHIQQACEQHTKPIPSFMQFAPSPLSYPHTSYTDPILV